MATQDFTQKIQRPAAILQVGGFRPDNKLLASYCGNVRVGLPHESWPEFNGAPMFGLCQINFSQLDFMIPELNDIKLITVFVAQNPEEALYESSEAYLVRSYSHTDQLCDLPPPGVALGLKEFPLRVKKRVMDNPLWLDIPVALPGGLGEEEYDEQFPNHEGIKLGGWPTSIQDSILEEFESESPRLEFVLQIDGQETLKSGFSIGDAGLFYFALEHTPDGPRWYMTLQSC